MQHSVVIHIHGVCTKNPGPGGWAAYVLVPEKSGQLLSGGYEHTTDNRMHLMALIQGLSSLEQPSPIEVYSRSQYVCNAIEKKWLTSWIKRGWQTAEKKPVKNKDLWEELVPLLAKHTVTMHCCSPEGESAEAHKCVAQAQRCAQQTDLPRDAAYDAETGRGQGTRAPSHGKSAEKKQNALTTLTSLRAATDTVELSLPLVTIYTDGSCLGNPGRGGWSAIIYKSDQEPTEMSGGFSLTTNNRMEILSVLQALSTLDTPSCVTVYSDSQYVCNAIEKGWIFLWAAKNWTKSSKEAVKNSDLWEALFPLLKRHIVTMRWIEGHAGHPQNERCDALARKAAAQKNLPRDPGFTD